MLKNIITKKISVVTYLSSITIIFLSLCVVPTLGLILKVKNFQCDGCSFLNNFLVSLIGIIAWSLFYGVFHLTFFSSDYRSDKINTSNFFKIYPKLLQHLMRDKKVQSVSIFLVMAACYLILVRFFILQMLDLLKGI